MALILLVASLKAVNCPPATMNLTAGALLKHCLSLYKHICPTGMDAYMDHELRRKLGDFKRLLWFIITFWLFCLQNNLPSSILPLFVCRHYPNAEKVQRKRPPTFMGLVAGFMQVVKMPERRYMTFEIFNPLLRHFFSAKQRDRGSSVWCSCWKTPPLI